MLIKYFYLFFTSVSARLYPARRVARLKHNLRLLFQYNTMYKKEKRRLLLHCDCNHQVYSTHEVTKRKCSDYY